MIAPNRMRHFGPCISCEGTFGCSVRVIMYTSGKADGYSSGNVTSTRNTPPENGVPAGPEMVHSAVGVLAPNATPKSWRNHGGTSGSVFNHLQFEMGESSSKPSATQRQCVIVTALTWNVNNGRHDREGVPIDCVRL